MSSGEVEGFSPKVLFATSGAANAGIDNSLVHGVFRGEIPPTIEDAAQEMGRAGRRAGANKDSDFCVTCISLESYLILLKRIHTSTVGIPTYRRTLLYELRNVLTYMVILTHCLNATFADKQSNPFQGNNNGVRYLPPPCMNACSFCVGDYKEMFPPVIRSGVTIVLMDLFSGTNRIGEEIIFDPVLLKAIV